MIRATLIATALALATTAQAGDPMSRAAAALGVPCQFEARAVAALAPDVPTAGVCDCHATGDCRCEPGTCQCCKSGCRPYAEQYAAAVKSGKVLVGYLGCTGTCVDGALTGQMPDPHPRIVVGRPSADGTFPVAAELPATATAAEVKAAVAKATAATPPPPVNPFASPCVGGKCAAPAPQRILRRR